ncbi:hypothetical protein ACJMK2_014813 [Sinanodonta woodiana]|uniref:Lipocalin n=1 Tax=Sinanodonta woodiana TaxID=1069815 RepID=A0ABD3V1S1_SINWO
MKVVVVLAALIAVSYGQTHHPHTVTGSTHDPNVHEAFNFFYDFHTQKMMVTNHHNCYVFTLSDREKVDVHNDPGLTAIELKLLQMVDSATKTEVPKSSLEASVVHACGQNVRHYFTMS